MARSVKIAVVGSGYVGLVAAVCFAEIGHEVICIDNDSRKTEALSNGISIIHEEHLPELLKKHNGRTISFTTDLAAAVQASEVIFIAVGTPQSDTGHADLSYIEAVASEVARSINGYKVLVEKSTVPVYTNEWIRRTMERHGVEHDAFDVVSNPEFLREGTAIQDFLHPDRIVVGSDHERAAELLDAIYAPLTKGEYYKRADALPGRFNSENLPPLLHTSTKSAEIIKHASNAFLALKISFINAVANLCEAAEADVVQVAQGMGLDERIGNRFLSPGIGYGGSCFPKDVAAFRSVAEQFGLDFGLLSEVEKINRGQQKRFFEKVRSALWTLRGKKLAVLGLSFKGDTDDIRESPAIDLIRLFLAEGCSVAAFDPAGIDRTKEILPESDKLRYAADAYDAAEGADALLILTDWKEFGDLDLDRMRLLLQFPILIDGRNLYKPSHVTKHGFSYFSVGRSVARPVRSAKAPAQKLQTV